MNTRDERPVPAGWRWVRLGEVCESRTGTRDPASTPDDTFYYVDISSVDNDAKRIVSPKLLLGKDAPSRARQVIYANDVIVSTTRPNLNAVALVPPQLHKQICSTGFCVLRATNAIDPIYLFAFVQSAEFVEKLSELVKGALYPAVTDKQVREQLIPVPPLAEQQRIAALLTKQMAAVERARQAAEAQMNAALRLPTAYLRAAFESPEAQVWPRQPLVQVCDFLPARSITTAGDTQVRAITTACLTESGFRPSGIKTARMWAEDAAECMVRPGEVLIARSNTADLVGRVSVYEGIPSGVVASDLTIRIWPLKGMLPSFLGAYLSFLYQSGYWREKAGGASDSMKKITRSQIRDLLVPVPSRESQERIVTGLAERIGTTVTLHEALGSQLSNISELPTALLRQAFIGAL